MIRRLLPLAALLAAGRAGAACQIGIMATLPVTMQGLRPIVTATINGTDAPFVVDSGAFYSVITPGSARQFGLRLTSAPPGFYLQGVGGSASAGIATVAKFGIAGQTLDRVQFIVGGSELGQDNTGVIGYNVLGLGDTEYDLAHGVVRLIKPTGCTRANQPYWAPGTGSEIVTEAGIGTRATRIVARVFVNGVPIRAQFDTGAEGTAISRAAATRAGLDVDGPGAHPSGLAGGVGRQRVRQWTVPVDIVKIGDEEVRKTRLTVVDQLFARADEPEMLLGADFFLSHRVYVARDLHRLYFVYNGGNVFNLRPPVAVPSAAPGVAAPAAAIPVAAADPKAAGKDETLTAEDLSRRGAASAARRDFAAAIADLTKAIALAPAEPRYLAERAAAYTGNHQPLLAMDDLDAALRLKPDDVPTRLRRAVARMGRDRAGALADLDAVAAAAPREADLRFTLGQLYGRLDELPKAIAQYDLWIPVHRDDSKQGVALDARCWSRALLGTDLDLAQKDCAAARRLLPGNPGVQDSMALIRLRRGDNAGAIADYDRILAKQPKLAWPLYGRGLAKARLGRPDADADIAAARAIAPLLPALARNHGLAVPGDTTPPAPVPAEPLPEGGQ
ncbi:MAG: retroviral-like aspartic protease family protein [Sphingomonadaceae bacterium]|nr:retroviral-like aspartic protease family protein [Sphingomonadaceae bacterium]